MGRSVAYMTAKRGMADALRAVIASGGNPYEQTRARLLEAVTTLAKAGVAAGTIRVDVEPIDILTSLSGLCSRARARGSPARFTHGWPAVWLVIAHAGAGRRGPRARACSGWAPTARSAIKAPSRAAWSGFDDCIVWVRSKPPCSDAKVDRASASGSASGRRSPAASMRVKPASK